MSEVRLKLNREKIEEVINKAYAAGEDEHGSIRNDPYKPEKTKRAILIRNLIDTIIAAELEIIEVVK